jgi:DNA modification methylase
MTIRVETTEHCTLYCGDCLDVLPTLGKVDAVVADPPYGIRLQNHCVGQCMDGSRRQRRASDDWSIKGDDSHEVADAIREWSDTNGVCVAMFGSAFKPYGGDWRNILVWNKGLAVGGGGDPERCFKRTHELIFIANNGPLRGKRDGSVIDWPVNPSEFEFHPAQKPVGLMAYLIEQLTDAGNLVVDPCMGSGSTALACIDTGRLFVGVEADASRFDVALNRIREAERMAKCDLFKEPKPVERKQLELV